MRSVENYDRGKKPSGCDNNMKCVYRKERNSYLQKRENENVIFSLRSVLDETQEQLSKLEDNSISR